MDSLPVLLSFDDLRVFQWSHFFSEMDSTPIYHVLLDALEVSMEPLLFRNG